MEAGLKELPESQRSEELAKFYELADQLRKNQQQELEQIKTAALAMGYMRMVGKTADGHEHLQLTTKGVIHTAFLGITNLLKAADKERRDFTEQEKQEALEVVHTMQQALTRGQAEGKEVRVA